MASLEDCTAAIERLVRRLDLVDPELRRRYAPDRSLTCQLSDLGVHYSAEVRDGALHDLRLAPNPKAQVRVKLSSDDLVAIERGLLHPAQAWATGRLRLTAPFRDLLRLRSLF